mmetsp:Transcript_20551/g.65842  ORF Transcript_20551/g.65842 Transcript_20551/m.65842 type:complete len:223 (-) Transcript_20551:68-736(-)
MASYSWPMAEARCWVREAQASAMTCALSELSSSLKAATCSSSFSSCSFLRRRLIRADSRLRARRSLRFSSVSSSSCAEPACVTVADAAVAEEPAREREGAEEKSAVALDCELAVDFRFLVARVPRGCSAALGADAGGGGGIAVGGKGADMGAPPRNMPGAAPMASLTAGRPAPRPDSGYIAPNPCPEGAPPGPDSAAGRWPPPCPKSGPSDAPWSCQGHSPP